MLEPLNVQKINEMFGPNSPFDWALTAGPHGKYQTLVAVGYGPAPRALAKDEETLIVIDNPELEKLRKVDV